MQRRVRLSIVGLVVVAALVLAACGGTTTAQCLQQANTSLGTIITGQVSIATDHSVYAPGDVLQATITNHLATGIVINNYDFTARCPYFALQMCAGNDWQDMPVCPPLNGDTQPGNGQQLIAAGASFSSGVGIHADLPAGTYRLLIPRYIVLDAQGRNDRAVTTESATFRVCACRVCA